MSLKQAAIAGAILALCVGAVPEPASAQSPNCVDLYNQVMTVYQAAPQSPEYNQISAAYSANCLVGQSAAATYLPDYPQYSAPEPYYGYEPYYPAYGGYGYAVPVGVGLGLGVGRGFHHDRGFRGGDFHEHGGFRGAGFSNGSDFHDHGGGGHGGEGHGGDHHDHH
jgi:hypothetical protein